MSQWIYLNGQYVMVETIRRNALRDGYIRIIVSRGAGDLDLDSCRCPQASGHYYCRAARDLSGEAYRYGLRTVSVSQRRNIRDALNPKIKSLNDLNNILIKIQSNQTDVGEAIMLNAQGYVVEDSCDNTFLLSKKALSTLLHATWARWKALRGRQLWNYTENWAIRSRKNRSLWTMTN